MKLVLTGGPSGGKTTLAQAIQKEFASSVVVVPEAASIVFGGGWPRRKSEFGVQQHQKAIYFLQRELESLMAFENPQKLLICDRGSLDGMAYWPGPGGPSAFLTAVATEIAPELARYEWVMHLDTAPASYYDESNPLRNENHIEASALNDLTKQVWGTHPQRFIVDNGDGHFIEKMHRALFIVEHIIEGKSYQEILSEMFSDP